MKPSLLAVLALLSVLLQPVLARADATGGVSGYVIDESNRQPVPGVAIIIARLPDNSEHRDSALTNKRGFFSNIGLEPGRYAVTANVQGRSATCIVDDVFNGQVRHLRIVLSNAEAQSACVGPHVHRALVNPDETASVYRVK